MKNGRTINTLSSHLKKVFGGSVSKVTFKLGLDCPNRVNGDGCIFCSGLELVPRHFCIGDSVGVQIKKGMEAKGRKPSKGYVAYLQDHTGTNCPPDLLLESLKEAAEVPGVLAVSVGTRPDCLEPDILDVLTEVSRIKPVWLEIGLQSSSAATLAAINRGHDPGAFTRAASEAINRGFEVIAHVVLGLPGEGIEDCIRTAGFLADARVHGVKIHNIIVLRDTKLHKMHAAGLFKPPEMDEYCAMAVSFLEHTPEDVVIHRLAADASADLIVAPDWAKRKLPVIAAI
ncbi:MAG: TIGR01212 family radical SAM protein, partial [Myxococcota bacterium]